MTLQVTPVMIIWRDSSFYRDEPPLHITRINLGFAVCEDETSLVIAKEIQNERYIDFIRILRSQIVEVRKLGEVPKTP